MKKITIVGRGTVGCLAVSHFLRWTPYEIEWLFDPNINPVPVGEGTNLALPQSLYENLDFDGYHFDQIHSTPKLGIWKRGWGKGKEFKHTFSAGNIGIHFNALEFQDYVFEMLKSNPRITIKEGNYSDPNSIDSDLIMVCTGSPKNLNDDFIEQEYIPVNSAIVFQCPWEMPKFFYSITFAKKYGWVFGIPLQNRCAIGYVHNRNFCTEEDIKEDVQSILDEFNLEPKVIRNVNFNNYVRKINFNDRVIYNGNASFFLEPLEATSTSSADKVNRITIDLHHLKEFDQKFANDYYHNMFNEIGCMISLHYLSGSVYKNDFWKYAKNLAKNRLKTEFKRNSSFTERIKTTLSEEYTLDSRNKFSSDVGTWPFRSFKQNIDNLGLDNNLRKMMA